MMILDKTQIIIWLDSGNDCIISATNNLLDISITKVLLLFDFNIINLSTFINVQVIHFDADFTMVYRNILVCNWIMF